MPHKYEKEKNKIPKALDRRIKLTEQDKKDIREAYRTGILSIRAITRQYNVSRRLIQFTIFPERQKKNLEDRDKRGGYMQYYDKEKHRKSTKRHRHYKNKLYLEGKLDGKSNPSP